MTSYNFIKVLVSQASLSAFSCETIKVFIVFKYVTKAEHASSTGVVGGGGGRATGFLFSS